MAALTVLLCVALLCIALNAVVVGKSTL